MSVSLSAKARTGGCGIALAAVTLALGLFSAAPASAEWHRGCCWGPRFGVVVAPPVVYGAAPVYAAPPPGYYAPPPPVVYAPPPVVYSPGLSVNIR
jgi:hypothetical protein